MKPVPGLLAPEAENATPSVRLPGHLVKPECPKGLTNQQRMDILTSFIVAGGSANGGVPISFGDRRKLCDAMARDSELRRRYEEAMRIRADMLAEEIVSIADVDDDPVRARNRISARTWWASKLHPRRYGERLEMNLHTDVSAAEALAEARARIRPSNDSAIDAEIVSSPALDGSCDLPLED